MSRLLSRHKSYKEIYAVFLNGQKIDSHATQQKRLINLDNNKNKQSLCSPELFYSICQKRYLSAFHRYQSPMDVPEGVFQGKVDRFNGITVRSQEEYVAKESFPDKLKKSLEHWVAVNRRAIWFIVDTAHSDWIPILTQNGFEYHHAKKGYVTLYRWLPTSETINLPDYAHTMMGVGGLVINDQNEILVVSERNAMIPDSWKLPGGYVDPKENFIDAAIREVREETGIDCTFRTVVSLRHAHGSGFGCSDVYIVIALAPLHMNLQRCEREIAKLQWMPLDEYLQHPNVHENNRNQARLYLDYEKRGLRFTCEKATHPILKKDYMLYFLKPLEEKKTEPTQNDKAQL